MRAPSLAAAAALLSAAVGTAALAAGPADAATPQASRSPTVIAVDATRTLGSVSPGVLGQVYSWQFGGMESFNPATDQFYPQFIRDVQLMHPGSIRFPGGIASETFQWERAIGPESQRTDNAYGPGLGPSPSTVGPDEFGQLLDLTGAEGVYTVSFGFGTAQQAADLVEYMTGKVGTSRWADLRAENGHPQPYNVPYWEVGNEEYAALYWRSGTPVSVGGPPGACHAVTTCLYIYGGSTRFTNQPVVGYANQTPQAAYSTGAPAQVFYATYAPVMPGSQTVYVSGKPWTEVATLATAGPTGDVYTLDPTTGAITFGNGVHGAIPPKGDLVTLTYVSGPHGGFVQFYQAMKAANPSIAVCSSDTNLDFIESMGSTLPYDCLQQHQYAYSGTVANDVPITQYQEQLMAASQQQYAADLQLEASIEEYAKRYVPLDETEYGQFLSSNPNGQPYFHYSLDEALLLSSQLAEWIRLGLPVADHQLLSGAIPPPSLCCVGLPQNSPYATTASIGTPGPNTVLEATGELYQLFAPLAGGELLSSQTLENPVLSPTTGTSDLSVVAVRKGNELYLVAINRSPTSAVASRVLLQGVRDTGPTTTLLRLDGPSSLSYNTGADPSTVTVTREAVHASGSELPLTLPAHSITTVEMPVAPTPTFPLSEHVTALPGVGVPGGHVTLRTTVINSGSHTLRGTVQAILPQGWSARPLPPTPARPSMPPNPSASPGDPGSPDAAPPSPVSEPPPEPLLPSQPYTVAAHSQTTVDLSVTLPAEPTQVTSTLGSVLLAPDGSVLEVGTTTVSMPVTASCVLGSSNTCTGMTQIADSADGVTTPLTVDGLSARETVQVHPNDFNIYFAINPSVAQNGDYAATFTFRYFDGQSGTLLLEYDSTCAACGTVNGAYTATGAVFEYGSGTWEAASFSVNNARFAGRENNSSDFRVASSEPIILHSITVTVGPAVPSA